MDHYEPASTLATGIGHRTATAADAAAARHDEALLGTVTARLRALAGAALEPHRPGDGLDKRCATLGAGVLASAATLDLLEQPLQHERERARRMALELLDARLALARTCSELKDTRIREREAHRRALQDGLTALPNRAGFCSLLDQSLTRAEPDGFTLAVLYLDLDNFKAINDTHGHAVGDMLLRIVAARLRAALRAGDSVGRMGGDEFACLVTHLPDRRALARLAVKLTLALLSPMKVGTLDLQVQASVGIAVWPQDGGTGDDLLRNADHAMYDAKRKRCGHAFFDLSQVG